MYGSILCLFTLELCSPVGSIIIIHVSAPIKLFCRTMQNTVVDSRETNTQLSSFTAMSETGVLKYHEQREAVFSVRYSPDSTNLAVGFADGCLEVRIVIIPRFTEGYSVEHFCLSVCLCLSVCVSVTLCGLGCGVAPYGPIHSIFGIWVANHLMKCLLTVSRRFDKMGLAKSRFF